MSDRATSRESNSWEYPIFLIQHAGGYASIVRTVGEGETEQSLVVFRVEAEALAFATDCGLTALPRALRNDREFRWLLKSLQAPVASVVFDPASRVNAAGDRAQQFGVQQLLEELLTPDNSPWNYPVYVAAQDEGFVSIEGRDGAGRMVTAIGFFASEDRVQAYLDAAGEVGTACALENMEQARRFLSGIQSHLAAVAWNPTVTDGVRSATHCFAIRTLLERYLVLADDVAPD